MPLCLEDFFDQFRKRNHDDGGTRSKERKSEAAIITFLSQFGNDVYNCNENFIQQKIDYKDLASLKRKDLELLGISNVEKQTEMLDTFKDLSSQHYSLDEVIKSTISEDFNRQMLKCAASYLKLMKLALAQADIKLQVAPSVDVVIEEQNTFASKFVLNALEEANRITEQIGGRLKKLENMLEDKNSLKKRYSKITTVLLTSTTLVGLYFLKTRYLK